MPATQKSTTDYTDVTDSQTVDGRRAAVNNQCYPWPTLGQAVPSVVPSSAGPLQAETFLVFMAVPRD
ncbi:MAG: hypothetical protein HYV36_03580 [Lentisphaerae bacterium]|nr:hypothetical protein [Lentisphaerota bacterium]